ncbi:MAG: hypothetical protein ACLUW6_02500 [Coriobacteriaceae bacterium]
MPVTDATWQRSRSSPRATPEEARNSRADGNLKREGRSCRSPRTAGASPAVLMKAAPPPHLRKWRYTRQELIDLGERTGGL